MISITKGEAMALREKYGDGVSVSITNRHKKGGRKCYYAEETSRVLFFIERLRDRQFRKVRQDQKGRVR